MAIYPAGPPVVDSIRAIEISHNKKSIDDELPEIRKSEEQLENIVSVV